MTHRIMTLILLLAWLTLGVTVLASPKEAEGVVESKQQTTANAVAPSHQQSDVRTRAIRLGLMLPLHDLNNEGKRMIEYYRGVLMACDSVKKQGISVDVYAWNLPEDGNISATLSDPNAATCDIIIGPYYSKYVSALSEFVEKHNIMLVIPFSIVAPELYSNRHIFQIYQHFTEQNEKTVRRFLDWFSKAHPIIVDCNDTNSSKGSFTSLLRRQLEGKNVAYSLTSLTTEDDSFKKAFVSGMQNVVVPNSSRLTDMNALFGKLSSVSTANPDMHISVFGYTEWMPQAVHQLENFYRYDVYIPSDYYTNMASVSTNQMLVKYRKSFRKEMVMDYPHMALCGFDHAYYFLKGLHKYGKEFDGAADRFGYPPVQTPLKFERIGNGGLQNRAFLFVHYKPEHQIELLNY